MAIEATPPSYPRWMMLGRDGEDDKHSPFPFPFPAADDTTAAASFTSNGHPIVVYMGLAAPPTASCLYAHSDCIWGWPCVIAAHHDSILVQIRIRSRYWRSNVRMDHLVYSAGTSRPPSLRLLPPCNFFLRQRKSLICTEIQRGFFIEDPSCSHIYETPRHLDQDATGFLRRRGKDGFVVVELQMVATDLCNPAAELLMLRSGGKWSVRRVPIDLPIDKCREISSWNTHTVVAVGDRILCWVDLSRGVIFSDVIEDRPGLRYISLPVMMKSCYNHWDPKNSRNVCATTAGVVKLVDIFNTHRCSCGVGATNCNRRSCYAYTVQTWILRMEDMVWVKDSTLDVAELWAQDEWKGLPHIKVNYPVVSIDDPNIICFLVWEYKTTQWLIMVDMRSRTVQSVSRCPQLLGRRYQYREPESCIPSKFSSYLSHK